MASYDLLRKHASRYLVPLSIMRYASGSRHEVLLRFVNSEMEFFSIFQTISNEHVAVFQGKATAVSKRVPQVPVSLVVSMTMEISG